MVSVAIAGLVAAVAMNLLHLGRADRELLTMVANLLRHQISCSNPQDSALFRGDVRMLNERLNLNALLFDSSGHLIAAVWPESNQMMQPSSYQQAIILFEDSKYQPLFRGTGAWAIEQNICAEGWTLFLNDTDNALFEQVVFERQRTMYLFTSFGFAALILAFGFYLSSKGKQATRVLRSFAKGDLQERLSIFRWERSFELLHEFNRMAEKLSGLFERIHRLELSRSQLISELAHDTRTPLASLRSGVDTLREFGESLSQMQLDRILSNMSHDLDYFTTLVDDLFLLAELDSKSENLDLQAVDVNALLIQVANNLRLCDGDLRFESYLEPNDGPLSIEGDQLLLQRMLVNLLGNAQRYGRSKIKLSARPSNDKCVIEITNDSQPLSEEQLHSWGMKRRIKHHDMDQPSARASLGLGSSIACRIAEIHSGIAGIEQSMSENENCTLVKVTVCLPRFQGEKSRKHNIV
jgi:signal transduction histidine kinase